MPNVSWQKCPHPARLGGGLIAQFRTDDDAIWVISTSELTWARVSVDGNMETSQVSESGKLIPQGPYIFALEDRTPDTEGPGVGLCAVMFLPEIMDQTLHIVLRTNVKVKEFKLLKPITEVRYEIMNPQSLTGNCVTGPGESSGLPPSAALQRPLVPEEVLA